MLIRADCAGATHGLLSACRARGVGFSVGLTIDERIRQAIWLVPEQAWTRRRPAPTRDGSSCSSGGQRVRPLTGPSGASRGWAGSGEASGAGRSLSCWPSVARSCARAAPAWARAVAAAVLVRSTAGGW